MRALAKRGLYVCSVVGVILFILIYTTTWGSITTRLGLKVGEKPSLDESLSLPSSIPEDKIIRWVDLPQRYPVTSMRELPSGLARSIPKIQDTFSIPESPKLKEERESRRGAVKDSFIRTWKGYKEYGWLRDEVRPVSKDAHDPFGGWAATLVDSLDTLWIMGLQQEFEAAVKEVSRIEFGISTAEAISVFETNIRFLGGFLAAHDLSRDPILYQKALEVGDMLYAAFDTPNRIPVGMLNLKEAAEGFPRDPGESKGIADVGSLSLEFTRLSQLSGDPKYFDAIQGITDQLVLHQNDSKLPGMWPIKFDPRKLDFTVDATYSFGGSSDSFYEYLLKEYLLLGGLSEEYRTLYEASIDAAKQHMFFRPLNMENLDVLISGTVRVKDEKIELEPVGQHLGCFAGGMLGMGARIFARDDIATARKLALGCVWAYENTPTGIMPETFYSIPCTNDCEWSSEKWYEGVLVQTNLTENPTNIIEERRLQPGFTDITDYHYNLRPEAIESLFILYRLTGDRSLPEKAWKMFQAIEKYTRTEIAYSTIEDVTVLDTKSVDRMESFWTAETLKYFYLIFSEPNLISLDEYVFNTEAHPLKRPKADETLGQER